MRLKVAQVSVVLAATLLSTAVESQVPATIAQLRSLTGSNLNARTMTLPRDLPADPALLFIAFDQAQQSQIDSWTKSVNDSSAVPWLEVAIIEPSNAFVRAMIADGMRRNITTSDVRERVVTVYTAPDSVARAVGCTDLRKRLCVVVAEKSGRVRLVLTGAYTPEAANRVLESMGPTDKTQALAP
jgi:hypothetical protein